jgi:hypothetical protein
MSNTEKCDWCGKYPSNEFSNETHVSREIFCSNKCFHEFSEVRQISWITKEEFNAARARKWEETKERIEKMQQHAFKVSGLNENGEKTWYQKWKWWIWTIIIIILFKACGN